MKEGVEVNPLYSLGLERIGCWLCPSSSLYEIEVLKELHPDLWQGFEKALSAQGYSEEEVRAGFWRWRRMPKGQEELRKRLKVESGMRKEFHLSSPKDMERAKGIASSLGGAVTDDILLRSALCLGCGVCLAHCEYGAIEFQGGKVWLNSKCKGCRRCHLRCPIVKYIYGDTIINNHDN